MSEKEFSKYFLFLSCLVKKARLTIVGQGTKEDAPKRMLLPTLPKSNISGKKVSCSSQEKCKHFCTML
ncbi:hypothetical protein LA303_04965 [Candidatus Sulfidibacterium hydrothermale]|uniref:hypothetical protein n=1 Tax=Candidatus Sulfidibacterium hydrothermale TaxID=2875962 RepID=UPI001F0B579B|nr:hypothetical protein [Candidatus Sulfidibacterium hydrothermale]UBM63327.1 hypothetical protein LA303_04965 [Candidatus Sulfidibacterium hydrothermale]